MTIACMLSCILAFSQKPGDYRSVASGNWNEITTWQIFTDSGWKAPSVEQGGPTSSSGIIQIQSQTKVTITDTITADQVLVSTNGTLVLADSASFTLLNAAGSDLIVEGVFENAGLLQIKGTISLQPYCLYRHKTSLPFPSESIAWHPYSKIEFSGGGLVDWQLPNAETTIYNFNVSNNTTLNLIGGGESSVVTLKNGVDSGLCVANGSTINLGAGISKFAIGKKSSARIRGILSNSSAIDLSEVSSLLLIEGKLINAGKIFSASALSLIIGKDAIYEHNQDGGVVPIANWSANSTCVFARLKTTLPQGLNQVFGNINFESTLSKDILLQSSMDCSGNMIIANSGSSSIVVNNDSLHHTIFIGGNLTLKSGNLVLTTNAGNGSIQVEGNFNQVGGTVILKTAAGDAELFIAGDLYRQEGSLLFNSKDSLSEHGISTLTVKNNFEQTGGTINFSSNRSEGLFFLSGNFKLSGGTLTETGTGSGTIHFNGQQQQLYDAGGALHNNINLIVDSLSYLQMAFQNSRITSQGRFVLEPGSTFGIKHPSGLTLAPSNYGHITNPVREYNSGVHFIYNGNENQLTGEGLQNIIPASLTIDNPTTVSLSSPLTVGGNINILQGEFYSRNLNLVVNGNWVNNGVYNPGNSSLVTFKSDSLQFISGAKPTGFFNLSIDNSEGVRLENNISISSQLSLINGILDVGDHVLIFGPKANPIKGDSLGSYKMIALEENGQVRKEANMCAKAEFYYPIGNISGGKKFYSPISISFYGGTYSGYSGVSVTDKKHPNNPDSENFLTRYWTIKQEGFKGFTASVTAIFDSSDVTGSPEFLRLGKYSKEIDTNWISYPEPPTGNVFSATKITSFSDFTGLGIKAIEKQEAKKAQRQMASSAALVPPAVDFRTQGPATVKLYPNPVTENNLQLYLTNFQPGQYEIIISNSLGQVVYSKRHDHSGGSASVSIPMSKQPGGIFHLKIKGAGENYFTSFLKK